MAMDKEEQKTFVNEFLSKEINCDLRMSAWHPTTEQMDWLLNVPKLRAKIHTDCPHILNLYDGDGEYSSPTEVTVYFKDERIDDIREHVKLKDLYNEWYLNKQRKEVNK